MCRTVRKGLHRALGGRQKLGRSDFHVNRIFSVALLQYLLFVGVIDASVEEEQPCHSLVPDRA